jgi:hypothetical protein
MLVIKVSIGCAATIWRVEARHERLQGADVGDALVAKRGIIGETRTLEDTDSRGEVVDTPGSAESGGNDGGGGDEIVGEAVVQVALCDSQQCALAKSEDAGQIMSPCPLHVPGARKHR